MINRISRLAQHCATLLLVVLVLSASFCPAQSHSAFGFLQFKRSNGNTSDVRSSRDSSLRSSAPDYLSEADKDGLYCWPADKLPVKVFFQPSDSVPFYRHSFPTTLKSCFDEWTAASNGKLAWLEVSDSQSADIVVRWSSQAKERPEGTEGGVTKTYGQLNTATNRGIIHKVEMMLLTRLPERELTDVEVRKAYLHEVGHALGIAGHSLNRSDIMYFAVTNSGGTHLGVRDVASINRLYSEYQPLKSLVGSRSVATKRDQS